MTAKIIDGKALAEKVRDGLKAEVARLAAAGRSPHLVTLEVGENPASRLYVKSQRAACQEIGIDSTLVQLPESVTQEDLEAEIAKINMDPSVTGLILQMPLPKGLDAKTAQNLIAPDKDVEGVSPGRLGLLVQGEEHLAPATARAAFELALSTGVALRGAEAVIVGRSDVVGKPLALLFLKHSATVTMCHTGTRDLAAHTRAADFLCVAAGRTGLVNGDMIRPGAVVIDVGINRVPRLDADGRQALTDKGRPAFVTVGDVDYASAEKVAGWITPVPGGVGPMTVAMLMSNIVRAALRQYGL